MLLILDHQSTQPFWNLAAEEYLLTCFSDPVFRLWRNAPSVIVGRHQNTWAEVNIPYIQQHDIPVVRRLSGGGAVFHDLGNINYSFMEPKPLGEESSGTFKHCTLPILAALNHIGIKAYLSGRNDLLIDGKKFSGTAQCVMHGRILLHGTLLYSALLSDLSNALKGPRSKFTKNAVPSSPSPVCNISSYLTDIQPVDQFMNYLANFMRATYPNIRQYQYTPNDLVGIELLSATKYNTDIWNWGEEPQFTHYTEVKTASGNVQLFYDTDSNDLISRIRIYGDYVNQFEREELEKRLMGCQPSEQTLSEILT
jgi:lipoate-protein ligase A